MDAKKRLLVLRDRWTGCTRCGLSKLRGSNPVVFGAGPYNADYLIITEAPSEKDVEQNLTLSGDEGMLFEDIMVDAGIDPARRVFRTSLVACRPYVVLPATEDTPERIQDRTPDKTEVEACSARITEIIYLVDPRLIIALGDGPWKTLIPTKHREGKTTITNAAGSIFSTYIPGRLRAVRYPVLALLPPKQLIANPSPADHAPMATTKYALEHAERYIQHLKEDERT